jgi:hypothetical protein
MVKMPYKQPLKARQMNLTKSPARRNLALRARTQNAQFSLLLMNWPNQLKCYIKKARNACLEHAL